MNDPNVVDWISGIGQVVGALGTLAAVIVALWIARRDGRRMEQDRRDRDTAQARLITSRLAEDWGEIAHGKLSSIFLRNNSSQAITNVQIVKVDVPGTDFVWNADDKAGRGEDMLGPGSESEFCGWWTHPNPEAPGKGDISAVDVRIQFVDASGLWWQRVNNSGVVRSRSRERVRLEWTDR